LDYNVKYIWTVQFDTRWTNTPKGEWEYSDETYTVVAKSLTDAITQGEKAAFARAKKWGDGINKLEDLKAVSVTRGKSLDA
jgi:hypothetical protein